MNLAPNGSALVEETNSRQGSGLPDMGRPGPTFQQPPPPELRCGHMDTMTGGKVGAPLYQQDSHIEGESSGPGFQYQAGPDIESGKAIPREPGKV